MNEREAMALLSLLQHFIGKYPGASPETWSAEFVHEAMEDPDLQHVSADDIIAAWLKELETKKRASL